MNRSTISGLVLLVALVGCGGGDEPAGSGGVLPADEGQAEDRSVATEAKADLKVATDPWSGAGIFYLAEEKGFFAEEGVRVRIVYFESYFDTIKAFSQGTIDVVQEALNDALMTAADGVEFVGVLATVENKGFDAIIVDPQKVRTLADLKGKKIGYVEGQMGHYLLTKAIEMGGLSEGDVIGVPLKFEEVKQAFEAGKIDGGCVNVFNESDQGVRIISSGDVPGAIDTLMIGAARVEASPDKVAALVRAWFRAVDYFEAHPEESIEIMARGLGMTGDEFRRAAEVAPILGRADQAAYYPSAGGDGLLAETVLDLHRFFVRTGFYRPEQQERAEAFVGRLDRAFDPRFLAEIGLVE